MTSETDAIKTNEFLRRRKLRLQQVREQSKDIAKKIRQRAKVEKLRQVVDLDAKKQKEYFECQERLVKRLELLYAKGLENVGAGHQSASEVKLQDEVAKTDLSKVRGKEATAELRRKKQEKLDQQKKLLDRKLQAREVANEISRDKTAIVANKLVSKTSKATKTSDEPSQNVETSAELAITKENSNDAKTNSNELEPIKTNDMATQWDMETRINEWEPAVPPLSLPIDKDTPKDSEDNIRSRIDKNKRLDLFALSDEMPTSLRGHQPQDTRGKELGRPSLNIVSEYLQTRKLRLRETEATHTNKKPPDDIQNLKHTIQHTRTNKPEGSNYNVCQVLDEQIIPVPTWRAERNCQVCSNSVNYTPVQSRQFKAVTNSQINQIFSSIRPVRQADLLPSPVLRGTSPFRRSKVVSKTCKSSAVNDKTKNSVENTLHRKNSVVMYNHSTRDTKDLPYGDDKLVVRDTLSEEDAYSQAMKEVSFGGAEAQQNHNKVQDMRNKVAVTKQTVEKEYKDTINFLNSMPKDKCSKVVKNAFMDERRQQIQQENRQRRMQQEYKNIERECKRHNCLNNSRNKSKSPTKRDSSENFDSRDFQYSWMPVPESDCNLAIHAIPNTVKHGKSGNSVKFSKVDSYHEYRSRHKHTPPTKETTQEKSNRRVVETVVIDNNTSDSESSSITSDTSSTENLRLNSKTSKNAKEINKNLSDAERIIIYKVLDSRSEKKSKRQTELLNEIAKSLTSIGKVRTTVDADDDGEQHKKQRKNIKSTSNNAGNTVSFEKLNEGVYKMVEEQGDNVAKMYFTDNDNETTAQPRDMNVQSCSKQDELRNKGTALHWESGDCLQPKQTSHDCQCPSPSAKPKKPPQPSTTPSTSSFITAANDKGSVSEGGYIKLVDETGKEAGKFYIGASGFLNSNSYEVVIQLRKKDASPCDRKDDDKTVLNNTEQPNSEINNKNVPPASLATDVNDVQLASDDALHEVLAYRSVVDKESKMIPPQRLQHDLTNENVVSLEASSSKTAKYHGETNTEAVDDIFLIQSKSNKKDMCDKGVDTHLTHEPKVDQLHGNATTTYTQTSSSSPIHRPVFFHMSSSTSTAYMSPPEVILPKFLRHDYGLVEDVLYDPVHTIEMTENEYCEQYADCTCRKCVHGRKVTIGKINMKNKYKDSKKTKTPTNSATNSESQQDTHDIPHVKNVDTLKTAKLNKRTCRHNSCGNINPIKKHRNKKLVENIRTSRNSNVHVGTNLNSRYKATSSSQNKIRGKSKLNPIIKDYVHKLLALNRVGLKAIEVAGQECSSVGTPGSSIINDPFNFDDRKTSLTNTISLEQIKKVLRRQILEENLCKNVNYTQSSVVYSVASGKNNQTYSSSQRSRKKPVHKVKSLNISKNLANKNKYEEKSKKSVSPSSTDETIITRGGSIRDKRSRSKSSPTPRQMYTLEPFIAAKKTPGTTNKTSDGDKNKSVRKKSATPPEVKSQNDSRAYSASQLPSNRATTTLLESQLTQEDLQSHKHTPDIPVSMSTQTKQNIEATNDTNIMKLAEDKIHNMEKIADLTEKCTKRLSNLAKVLEEVRKNKSLVYSQISSAESTDSQTDHKSDKVTVTPVPVDPNNIPQRLKSQTPDPVSDKESIIENELSRSEHISVLADIPKPVFKTPEPNVVSRPKPVDKLDSFLNLNANTAEFIVKNRPKPPPALSRLNFKHGREQEYIIPHELSTVIEVDSPMSMKHKNQSALNDAKDDERTNEPVESYKKNETIKDSSGNPDLLKTNANFSKKGKFSSTESSDDSKFHMIDLKQFNEIMLEPFISIQEYAKQYNLEPPEEDLQRDVINDDMSSLHSDGSLPDVIAELLKRNVITEPFKFDTASNINSTTVSSESTLSMLALSKARKDRKRSRAIFQNKENIGETSDTLSISSNPDLENAFKKLGMGWASSTLKKTKERLALSSSSNTSSSSLSQFKIKTFNQDIPVIVTDSVSSAVNISKEIQSKNAPDNSKNAEQQTTLSNSMTVKEFLRNELAKKITFNNKSNVNNTGEFVSLFETKMPEQIKDSSPVNHNERSVDSGPSGTNRARTSTPVQLFKSMTYHSSSSSNLSNGLFSNADDLSSVKMTSNSMKNHSTSDKDDLTIPNFSLRMKRSSDCSKSD